MHISMRITIFFFMLMPLFGCAAIKEHFAEVSTDLFREFGVISGYIESMAEEAEDKNNKRLSSELYKDVDELADSCSLLQESGYRKFFGIVLGLDLKLATINSLSTCEDKIREMQQAFPDYKRFEVWN